MQPTDYTAARAMMVDSQIRPNKVTDPRILGAMRTLPRERFVPLAMASLAYADEDVPLGGGRVLMEPMLIARLLQTAAVQPGERVLVLGAGCGYAACVLAACGAEVVAFESEEDLAAHAHALLAEFAPGVTLVTGRLADGWPALAPYDVVFIDGAFEELPPAVSAQLRRPGGRLLGVRSGAGRMGQAVLGEAFGVPAPGLQAPGVQALSMQAVFDAATPVLPELRRVAAFVF